jgi:hypothetical protein
MYAHKEPETQTRAARTRKEPDSESIRASPCTWTRPRWRPVRGGLRTAGGSGRDGGGGKGQAVRSRDEGGACGGRTCFTSFWHRRASALFSSTWSSLLETHPGSPPPPPPPIGGGSSQPPRPARAARTRSLRFIIRARLTAFWICSGGGGGGGGADPSRDGMPSR